MKLEELNKEDTAHWELHLNAVIKDTPSVKGEADVFLEGGELPDIKHPSYIHDWLEIPEMRPELEAYNG